MAVVGKSSVGAVVLPSIVDAVSPFVSTMFVSVLERVEREWRAFLRGGGVPEAPRWPSARSQRIASRAEEAFAAFLEAKAVVGLPNVEGDGVVLVVVVGVIVIVVVQAKVWRPS